MPRLIKESIIDNFKTQFSALRLLMFERSGFSSVVLASFLYATVLCLFGCNFESGVEDDQINLLIFRYFFDQSYLVKPTVFHYFYTFFPRLYSWDSSMPWFSALILIISYAVFVLFIGIMLRVVRKHDKGSVIFITLTVLLLLSSHIVGFTFTRISILGGAGALILQLILFRDSNQGYTKTFVYSIVLLSFFMFSILIRPETIFLHLMLLPVLYLVGFLKRKPHWVIYAVFILGGLAVYSGEKALLKRDIFYEKERYVTNIFDAYYVKPLNGNVIDERMSAKMAAIENWFTYDDSIDIDFLSKVSSPNIFSIEKLVYADNLIKYNFYKDYFKHEGLMWILFCCLLLFVLYRTDVSSFQKYILILTYVLVFFLVLTWFFKNEARIFSPIATVISLLGIVSLYLQKETMSKTHHIFLIVGVSLLIAMQANRYSAIQEENSSFKAKQNTYLDYTKQIVGNQKLVIANPKLSLLFHHPFQERNDSLRFYILDAPYFDLNAQQNKQGVPFIEGFKEFVANKEKYIFLMDPDKASFISHYISVIHGVSIEFEPVEHHFKHDGFLTFYKVR